MKQRPSTQATAPCRPRHQKGFTFLGLLLAIAVLGIGLSLAAEVWSAAAARQRAEQSQWAAQQFVKAIGSYYESGPAGFKQFPKRIDYLLDDQRDGNTRRHLRQIYLNPMNGRREWDWITNPDGGICGVKIITNRFSENTTQPTEAFCPAPKEKRIN